MRYYHYLYRLSDKRGDSVLLRTKAIKRPSKAELCDAKFEFKELNFSYLPCAGFIVAENMEYLGSVKCLK